MFGLTGGRRGGRTDKRINGRTDLQTDRWADRHTETSGFGTSSLGGMTQPAPAAPATPTPVAARCWFNAPQLKMTF